MAPVKRSGSDNPPASKAETAVVPTPAPPTLNYADLQRQALLYSNFRSGTNFFRSIILRLAPAFFPLEPFSQEQFPDGSFNFGSYLRSESSDLFQLLHNPDSGVRAFLAHLLKDAPAQVPIFIDLKYEQAYRLGIGGLLQTPVILNQFIAMKTPIIHLIRRDVVAQAVSHLTAMRTGVYVRIKDRSQPAPAGATEERFWLDPDEVLQAARSRAEVQQTAAGHLRLLGARHVTVFYEDLITSGWQAQFQRIFQFLDRYVEIPKGLAPYTERLNSAARVVNMRDIVDYIIDRAPELVRSYPVTV